MDEVGHEGDDRARYLAASHFVVQQPDDLAGGGPASTSSPAQPSSPLVTWAGGQPGRPDGPRFAYAYVVMWTRGDGVLYVGRRKIASTITALGKQAVAEPQRTAEQRAHLQEPPCRARHGRLVLFLAPTLLTPCAETVRVGRRGRVRA